MVGDRVTAKDPEHQHRRDGGQCGARKHHVTNRKTVDQLSAHARAHRLGDDPLRGEQGKARGTQARMKRGAQVRARDRPDRDHHPRREQVADCDQRYRLNPRKQHDEGAVQQL